MVCIAFALLACVKGHFACPIFKPFPLSSIPLVSIGSGKYSTDWVHCDGTFGGGRLQGCHGYLLPHIRFLPGATNILGTSSQAHLLLMSLRLLFHWLFSFLQTLLIEFQPLEKDAIKCRTSVNSVAAVAFYTGDEFLRRQYKK